MTTRVNPPRPSANKPNRGLWTAVSVLGVILIVLPMLVGLYTDFLWFGELDFRSVFNKMVLARVILFVLFAAIGGAIAFFAARIA